MIGNVVSELLCFDHHVPAHPKFLNSSLSFSTDALFQLSPLLSLNQSGGSPLALPQLV
jgi:hypothetical protein